MHHSLSITNTLTGKREQLKPLNKKNLSMYVCGITPYDYAHVGHGRCYVTFDMMYRLLKFLGYNVSYCRNFTDIDDKLLQRSHNEFGTPYRYLEIAQRYIDAYHEDMANLGCLVPDYEPRVTDTIPEIILFVQSLIDAGKAYVVDGSVYFRIASFKEYGALSHRNLDDLCVGARVEANQEKENPLDFVLWKSAEGEKFWESPWGIGRPGWHIECSAMSLKYLGKQLDIHGGGMDLIFPHHENEKAQSEGRFELPYVSLWMHNAFVRINKEKMSKSLNNFFTLRDLFEQFDPMVIRYYFVVHHYRNPLDFSWDDVASSQKAYEKLIKLFARVTSLEGASLEDLLLQVNASQKEFLHKLITYLAEDLNTAGMIGFIFESSELILQDEVLRSVVKTVLHNVLGLSLTPLPQKTVEITAQIQGLIQEREAARAARDWKRADLLRDQLKELGFEVQDKKL